MNLDIAIKTHAQWKTKFRGAIANQETMDAATIATENSCELGKWLHGPAKSELGSIAEYTATVAAHKKFHNSAGAVARLINSKKYAEAENALANGTDYTNSSMDVSVAINRLKKHVSQN